MPTPPIGRCPAVRGSPGPEGPACAEHNLTDLPIPSELLKQGPNVIGLEIIRSGYAERTPELPQTLRFVVDELKSAPKPEAALVEYAIAESFAATRAASPYEARGEGMAADLADGLSPEVVARFHRGILELRSTPDLTAELYRRMNVAYGRVLPGLSGKTSAVNDGVYLVIGPEKQFAAWEDYLRSVEGADAKLYRLYARDFWMTAD